MKIIKWFKDLFKCKHDWEIIKLGKLNRIIYYDNYVEYYRNDRLILNKPNYDKIDIPEDKVCIKCGECYNGIDKMEKEYIEYKKLQLLEKSKLKQRKEYAKQLWEDGCKGEKEKNENN